MGKIQPPKKVKLICGILFSYEWVKETFNEESLTSMTKNINIIIEQNLNKEIDLQSDIINFNFTDYYTEELGKEIYRYWVSFKSVVELDMLWKIKLETNNLEEKLFSINNRRKINLDPGYVDSAKLILFSTKNFSHRIYLSDGIYAEVTLIYKHKNFEFLTWTYPDYKTDTAIKFFSTVRERYLKER